MATGCKQCGRSEEKCICDEVCASCGAPDHAWNHDDTVRSIKVSNTDLLDKIAIGILQSLILSSEIDASDIEPTYFTNLSYAFANAMIKERKNHVV